MSPSRFPGIMLCALAALAVGLLSSCTCARKCASGGRHPADDSLKSAFVAMPGCAGGYIREFHVTRSKGQPVLLLHDITGPRPECLKLAVYLSQRGFRVYVPVFFGKFGENCPGCFAGSLFANRPGWKFRAAEEDQPCLPDVERLCGRIREANDNKQVIVMGNCVSGGMAAGLLRCGDVCAAVTSQPAVPYVILRRSASRQRALDVSPSTLREASARARTLRQPALLGFRFYRDSVSPESRLERLKAEFGESFDAFELCEFRRGEDKRIPATFEAIDTCKSKDHSVVIPAEGKCRNDYPKVIEKLVSFLKAHAQ